MSETTTLPLLLFDDLPQGRSFRPFRMTVTPEQIESYKQIVGRSNGLYDRFVPPGFAGIFGRLSYLQDYAMPPGGVLLGQTIEWLAPAEIGREVECEAVVTEQERDGDRMKVTLQTSVRQDGKDVCRITVRNGWPQ